MPCTSHSLWLRGPATSTRTSGSGRTLQSITSLRQHPALLRSTSSLQPRAVGAGRATQAAAPLPRLSLDGWEAAAAMGEATQATVPLPTFGPSNQGAVMGLGEARAVPQLYMPILGSQTAAAAMDVPLPRSVLGSQVQATPMRGATLLLCHGQALMGRPVPRPRRLLMGSSSRAPAGVVVAVGAGRLRQAPARLATCVSTQTCLCRAGASLPALARQAATCLPGTRLWGCMPPRSLPAAPLPAAWSQGAGGARPCGRAPCPAPGRGTQWSLPRNQVCNDAMSMACACVSCCCIGGKGACCHTSSGLCVMA